MNAECACTCGLSGCASNIGRQHGFPATYRNGCRCDDCTAVATTQTTARHKRTNDLSRRAATKSGQQWTGPEMEIVMRDDLTAAQAAEMLGRSIRAVENRRHLCRTDPKWIAAVGIAS